MHLRSLCGLKDRLLFPGIQLKQNFAACVVDIRMIVKAAEAVNRDLAIGISKKLDKCRNQENNPDSAM